MIQITLPWPPAALSPNAASPGAWRKKQTAAKAYRHLCGMECMAQGVRKTGWSHAHADITIHAPTARGYDIDNALARIKQGLDAISAAIGVDDRSWDISIRKGVKMPNGRVVVVMTDVRIPTIISGAS